MYYLWLLFCNFTLFIGSSRNYETNNNYNIVFNSFLNCVVNERTYLSALGRCGVDLFSDDMTLDQIYQGTPVIVGSIID